MVITLSYKNILKEFGYSYFNLEIIGLCARVCSLYNVDIIDDMELLKAECDFLIN